MKWTWLLTVGLALAMALPARADSLWEDEEKDSLYGEPARKGWAVHDLVTIVVEDRTIASVRGELQSDRRSRWEDVIRDFLRISTAGGLKFKDAMNRATPLEDDVESRFRNDNRAATNRSTQITYTITAEVKQVNPNGTLVLEARTTKKVGEEEEKVTLTGVARIEDVTAQNSIKAERLANLGLKVEGNGPVGDTIERGWLNKLLEKIWPF